MQQEFISGEINDFDVKVTHKHTQLVSFYFLVSKDNREFHLVLNLERLNKYIHYKHFKMENSEQVIRTHNKGELFGFC